MEHQHEIEERIRQWSMDKREQIRWFAAKVNGIRTEVRPSV
jgi:hypothetical protein